MVASFSGKAGTISWALHTKGNALAFLDKKPMNDAVRLSMVRAGQDWGATFLPKRFSHYVDRHPFPYPAHRLGFFFQKAKRMGIVAGIINRLSTTKGWDPWSSNRPPLQLIIEWKKMNPNKYRNQGQYGTGLIADMRRNAKRMVMEIIDEMWGDGKFIPLVETGLVKQSVLSGVKYRATATANNQTLRISMPMPLRPGQTSGKGGTSATVGAVLRTMPHWEVAWYAKKLSRHLGDVLMSRHGLSQNARGMVTQGARPGAQADQRATAQSPGR